MATARLTARLFSEEGRGTWSTVAAAGASLNSVVSFAVSFAAIGSTGLVLSAAVGTSGEVVVGVFGEAAVGASCEVAVGALGEAEVELVATAGAGAIAGELSASATVGALKGEGVGFTGADFVATRAASVGSATARPESDGVDALGVLVELFTLEAIELGAGASLGRLATTGDSTAAAGAFSATVIGEAFNAAATGVRVEFAASVGWGVVDMTFACRGVSVFAAFASAAAIEALFSATVEALFFSSLLLAGELAAGCGSTIRLTTGTGSLRLGAGWVRLGVVPVTKPTRLRSCAGSFAGLSVIRSTAEVGTTSPVVRVPSKTASGLIRGTSKGVGKATKPSTCSSSRGISAGCEVGATTIPASSIAGRAGRKADCCAGPAI